ncbi:hypothetical protein HK102_001031 [Quaeritorhiza haematococci]|nr:hypothetical protein HK102_001031 [Quaeritorhiza haematococci]
MSPLTIALSSIHLIVPFLAAVTARPPNQLPLPPTSDLIAQADYTILATLTSLTDCSDPGPPLIPCQTATISLKCNIIGSPPLTSLTTQTVTVTGLTALENGECDAIIRADQVGKSHVWFLDNVPAGPGSGYFQVSNQCHGALVATSGRLAELAKVVADRGTQAQLVGSDCSGLGVSASSRSSAAATSTPSQPSQASGVPSSTPSSSVVMTTTTLTSTRSTATTNVDAKVSGVPSQPSSQAHLPFDGWIATLVAACGVSIAWAVVFERGMHLGF